MGAIKITSNIVKYDGDHDVLHVFFAPLLPSFDDEEFPGIIVRRAASDDRITGLTIMNYSKRNSLILKTVLPRYDFSDLH